MPSESLLPENLAAPPMNPNLSNFLGTKQYLEILFTHYREDFISELRLAINQFKEKHYQIITTGYDEGRPNIDGGHYFNVDSFDGHRLGVSLYDYTRLQEDFQWNRSNLLKTDSLVAISKDYFQTWTYAIITEDSRPNRRNRMTANRGRRKQQRKMTRELSVVGYDGVSLQHLRYGDIWIIDPSSYFESCRPVLSRIKELQNNMAKLPFKKYIVDRSVSVSRPVYLDDDWENEDFEGMDESQIIALNHALSHEITLIQGAPGTGKTHCGVNLIRLLVTNSQDRKIVIMAYTNNAIDNFVLESEKIGVDTTALVRMGGQYCNDVSRYSMEARKNAWQRGLKGVLRRANIIALTTTGAAKYQSSLEEIAPKIVLVEEAAHVTEAHLIASLPSSCQHLILLGDYWQLRPHISEHAKDYLLDVSLFERLIRARLPTVTLALQYRMHQDLADVLVPHVYPSLVSHSSCGVYPPVPGVEKRVVFFQHENEEQIEDERETKSKMNVVECEFLTRFCQYLLQQGVNESAITILSIYKEQAHAIFDEMKSLGIKVTEHTRKRYDDVTATSVCSLEKSEAWTEGVRVTTVDAFQGEQNDIVLVSFVASSKTAFLDVNRVSASLSSAKHGFYAMGNFNAYRFAARRRLAYQQRHGRFPDEMDEFGRCRANNLELWESLYNQWSTSDILCNYIPIRCSNHGKMVKMTSAAHFEEYAPEGGCNSACEELACAHYLCERFCHPYGIHINECKETVLILRNGQIIPLVCRDLVQYEWEGSEEVELSFLTCKHRRVVRHEEALVSQCIENKTRTRDCGHSETVKCVDDYPPECVRNVHPDLKEYGCKHSKTIPCHRNTQQYRHQLADSCRELVIHTCPDCKHVKNVPCHLLRSTTCSVQIPIQLSCGHEKQVLCRNRRSDEAKRCLVDVNVRLTCGHEKTVLCSRKATPAALMCEIVLMQIRRDCGHYIASLRCREKSVRLNQPCEERKVRHSNCGHSVPYACRERSTYESESYLCATNIPVTRLCSHRVQNVACHDKNRVLASPCRVEVTTGFLWWKKRYECHEYEQLQREQNR